MTKKLILDFDNTIVNTTKAFIEAHKLICGRRYMFDKKLEPRWELVKKYDFSDQIKDLTTIMKIATFNSQSFYDNLEYYDNALEILEELSNKTDVHIVSMCSYDSAKKKGLKLQKELPNVKFQPIIFPYRDKSFIDMRGGVFIDDVAKNLETSSADVKICFKYNNITMDVNEDWRGKVLTSWNEDTYKQLKEILEIK